MNRSLKFYQYNKKYENNNGAVIFMILVILIKLQAPVIHAISVNLISLFHYLH